MGNRCQPCVKVVISQNSELQVKQQVTKISASFYTFGATYKEQDDIDDDSSQQKQKAEFTAPKKIDDFEEPIVSVDETITAKQQQVSQRPKKKLKMKRISSENQFQMMPSCQHRRISEQQLDKKYSYDQDDQFISSKYLKYHKWDGRTINQQLQQLRKVQKEQQQQFDMKFQSIGSTQGHKFQKRQSKDMQSRTKTGSCSNYAFIIE